MKSKKNMVAVLVAAISLGGFACGKKEGTVCGAGTHNRGGVCVADTIERPIDDAGAPPEVDAGAPAEVDAGAPAADAGPTAPVPQGTIRLSITNVPTDTDKLYIAIAPPGHDDVKTLLTSAQAGTTLAVLPAPAGGPYTIRVVALTPASGARRGLLAGGQATDVAIVANERTFTEIALAAFAGAVAESTPRSVVVGTGYTVTVNFTDPAAILAGNPGFPLLMSSALFGNGSGTPTMSGILTEVDSTHRRLDVNLTAPAQAGPLFYQAAVTWRTASDGSALTWFVPNAEGAGLARVDVVPLRNQLAVTVNGVPAGTDRVVAVVDQGGLAQPLSFDLARNNAATTTIDVPGGAGFRLRVAALAARRVPANDRAVVAGALIGGLNVPAGQTLPVTATLVAPSVFANATPSQVAPAGSLAVALDVTDPAGIAQGGTASLATAGSPVRNGTGTVRAATLTQTNDTQFHLAAAVPAPSAAGVLYYQARVRNDSFKPAGTADSVTLYSPDTSNGDGVHNALVTSLTTGIALKVSGLPVDADAVVAVIDGSGLTSTRTVEPAALNGITMPVDLPVGGPYRVRIAALSADRTGTYARQIVAGLTVSGVTVLSGAFTQVDAALERPAISQNATPATVTAGSTIAIDVTIKDPVGFSDLTDTAAIAVGTAAFRNDDGDELRTTKTKVTDTEYRFTATVAAPTAAGAVFYQLKLHSYNWGTRALFRPTGYSYYTSMFVPDVPTVSQQGALLKVDVAAPTAGLDLTLTGAPAGTDQIVALIDRGGLTTPLKAVITANGATTRIGVAAGTGYRLRAVAFAAKQSNWYRSVVAGVTIENLNVTASQFTAATGALTAPGVSTNATPATAKAGESIALDLTVSDPGGFSEGSGAYGTYYVDSVPFVNREGTYVSATTTTPGPGLRRFTGSARAPLLPGKLYYQISVSSSEFRALGSNDYGYLEVPAVPNVAAQANLLQVDVAAPTTGVKLTPSSIPVGTDALLVVVDKGTFGYNELLAAIPAANWTSETTLGIPAGSNYRVRVAAVSGARTTYVRQLLAGAQATVNVVADQFTTVAASLDAPVIRENRTPVNMNVGLNYKIDVKVYDPTGFYNDGSVDARTKSAPFSNGGGSYTSVTKTDLGANEYRLEANLTAAMTAGSNYYQLRNSLYDLKVPGTKATVYHYLPDVPDVASQGNLLSTTIAQLTNGFDVTLAGVPAGTAAVIAVIDGGGLSQPLKTPLTASNGATTRIGIAAGTGYRVRAVALTSVRSGYRQVLAGASLGTLTVTAQQFTAVALTFAAPTLDTALTATTTSANAAVTLDATLSDAAAFTDGATEGAFRQADAAFTNGGGTGLGTVVTPLTAPSYQFTATATAPGTGALYYQLRVRNDAFGPDNSAAAIYLYAPDIAVIAQQTNLPKVTVQ